MNPVRAAFLLLAAIPAQAMAQSHFAEADWALQADFPAAPKPDVFRKPTEFGDQLTLRYYLEQGGLRFMVARFTYPVVPLARAQTSLYQSSFEELMKSRPGEVKGKGDFALGPYQGARLLIEQKREKTLREVRLVLIGASLYVVSAEWPAGDPGGMAAECGQFLRSVAVRPEYADARVIEDAGRWRELEHGNFKLRYDGTRWYRDPTDNESGVFNLLRVDRLAEAQLIAEDTPVPTDSMETVVLASARETAESVALKKRGRKTRNGVSLEELEFTARVDGVSYVNHGYFYTGPAGTLQLRAWSPDKTYAGVAGDITELLDGLAIKTAAGPTATAAGR
ncbi:MAG: hypothetical protein HYV95_07875 [Opitutae bacterium]|nr:hypothetical protein [Opitutae bacterium]